MNPAMANDESPIAADTLDRYWDALVRNVAAPSDLPTRLPVTLDRALAATVHHFHRLDDTPSPDPNFASRLHRELFSELVQPAPGRDGFGPHRPRPLGFVYPMPGLKSLLIQFIAAAVLVVALFGARSGDRVPFPAFSGGSPTVSAQTPVGQSPVLAPSDGIVVVTPSVATNQELGSLTPLPSPPAVTVD
jgi:hypothetical protein